MGQGKKENKIVYPLLPHSTLRIYKIGCIVSSRVNNEKMKLRAENFFRNF